jgi:hypothetical protein
MCSNEIKMYNDFRTGFTFKDIYSMLWSNSDDPKTWHKANAHAKKRKRGKGTKTAGRRHAVLGLWRELKLKMWAEFKYYNQLEFGED